MPDLCAALVFLFLAACDRQTGGGFRTPVEFQKELAGSNLYASHEAAAQGRITVTKAGNRRNAIDLRLEPPLDISSPLSLVVEYGLRDAAFPLADRVEYVLAPAAGPSFVLPRNTGPGTLRYAAPLAPDSLEYMSITASYDTEDRELVRALKESPPVLELASLDIVPRWYGFEKGSRGIMLSPFVFAADEGSVSITVPELFTFPGGADLAVRAGGEIRCTVGNLRFEGRPTAGEFRIPAGAFPAGTPGSGWKVLAEGEGMEGVHLVPAQKRPFPEPIPLDPGMILAYPRSSWRRDTCEVFRWEGFPSLLIFDTADYTVQDRLLKRLAFFVEKAGYRGRLARDDEIADQHGWNAHDYRAQDLARFFEAVRLEDFPLLPDERELEAILFDAAIIRRDGDRILPGEGGIISISRESTPYLRNLFMAHEGFHGIFFVDEDFRDFSRRRWEGFSPAAKRFILSYFDYQHYDIRDEYLVVNEFMAHVLQQPVSAAARYFGETLASRIDASSWRRTVLPEKDEASGTWPDLAKVFREEAEAFDAYVNSRWGLSAGRVHKTLVRDLDSP